MDLSRHFNKINEINQKGAGFYLHLSFLRDVRFHVKPKWLGKFSKFSTTLSSKRIWLANNFHTWSLPNQIANLLHESVHCRQYFNYGKIHFLTKYASKEGRLEFEVEANKANIIFWLEVGLRNGMPFLLHSSPMYGESLDHYLDLIIQGLANDYLLGDWFYSLKQRDVKDQFLRFVKEWKNAKDSRPATSRKR